MAYDNNSDKVNYLKKTGTEIAASSNKIDISPLIDSSNELSSTLPNQDEIVVVRKFAHSTIDETPGTYDHSVSPITSDEAWSAWTIPNVNASGSTMYTISEDYLTFSTTSSDFTWTSSQSGRDADIILPVIAAADTIYILRKVPSITKLVNWTAGSRITSSNLNTSSDQLISLGQELITLFKEFHTINPSVGQPSGICPLDSSGYVAASFIDIATTLAIQTTEGVTGTGSTGAEITLRLDGDSLTQGASGVKADTQDSLSSTSTTKPLSANQGKALNDILTLLSSGIVYKGAVDVGNAYALGTASAGWTVTHTGAAHSGTRGSGWSIDTDGAGGADTLSVASGSLLRYNGTLWDVISSTVSILADGSVALNTVQAAVLQGAGNNTTRVATTSFVQQELASTLLSELLDVENDVNSAGKMLVRDSDTWEPIALETVDYTKEILSTGSSIKALTDVYTSMGTPSNGDSLTWNTVGGYWTNSTVASVTTKITCAGDGNGSTNDVGVLDTALTHAELGFNVSYPADSDVKPELDFRGRRHKTDASTQLTVPCRRGYTMMNGSIELNKPDGVDHVLLGTGTFGTQTTTVSTAAYAGTRVLHVANPAAFAEGDLVQIYGDEDVAFDVEFIKTNGAETTGTEYVSYQLNVVESIETSDTGVGKTITFRDPFVCDFSASATVSRSGQDQGGGTDYDDQIRDVVFEQMTFKDQLSQTIFFSEIETDSPINLTSGDATATFTLPASHGLLTGSSILLQDVDFTGRFAADGGDDGPSHFINRWTPVTGMSIATNEVTFEMESVANADVAPDTPKAYAVTSRHNGIELRAARDVTFRNCNFIGFNGEFAVKLDGCMDITFENCTFERCRGLFYTVNSVQENSCILMEGCQNVTINNCTFNDCTNCIQLVTANVEGYQGMNRDITVSNSTLEGAYGIVGAACGGILRVTDCVFNGNIFNPKRHHARYYGSFDEDGSYPHTAVIISNVCYGFIITNNTMANTRYLSTANVGVWNAAKYNAVGDGIDYGPTSGETLAAVFPTYAPVWKRGIYLSCSTNRYSKGNVFGVASGASFMDAGGDGMPRLISGNTLNNWDSNIQVNNRYNYADSRTEHIFGLTITNNTCQGRYNVYISSNNQHANLWWINPLVSGNNCFSTVCIGSKAPGMYWVGTFSSGTTRNKTVTNWSYNNDELSTTAISLRTIGLLNNSTGTRTRMRNVRVTDNVCNSDIRRDGYGIIVGGPSNSSNTAANYQKSGSVYGAIISGNYIDGYGRSLYVYKGEASGGSLSCISKGLVSQNVFAYPSHSHFGYSTQFEANASNKYATTHNL